METRSHNNGIKWAGEEDIGGKGPAASAAISKAESITKDANRRRGGEDRITDGVRGFLFI